MRLLRLLPWCSLLALGWSADCDWKMPVDEAQCEQTIQWRSRNDDEAVATCREYFATTFIDGKRDPTDKEHKIICTVYRQFQCNHVKDAVSMFDKCYKFIKAPKKMSDYLKDRDTICNQKNDDGTVIEGGLPVFFTMTQAKHIAMKAHREGINKMWVNVDKDGRTIDSGSLEKGTLIYKHQWKLHADAYWEGEELKMTPKENGEYKAPDSAKYLFFRSRTDHLNNLYQGSFERASEDTLASVVCEYEAKIVPDQQRYCAKMKALGLNAKYDERNDRKRCVYTSLTTVPMQGTKEAIESISKSICAEKPSAEHSSGLDDGTASQAVYTTVAATGTYRVAAIKIDNSANRATYSGFAADVRSYCYQGYTSDDTRKNQRQPFLIYDHFGKEDFSSKMQASWANEYPKDECTDFPNQRDMHSNTLAVRKGQIIDVPVSVPFPVICSIETQVDCGRLKKAGTPKCRADQICEDISTWNPDTGLFMRCRCPEFHGEENGEKVCKWNSNYGSTSCGRVHRYGYDGGRDPGGMNGWRNIDVNKRDGNNNGWTNLHWMANDIYDYVDKVVVRNGCKMTVWSHPDKNNNNYALLKDLTLGEYAAPLDDLGTLNGWKKGMAASAIECSCNSNPPLYTPSG